MVIIEFTDFQYSVSESEPTVNISLRLATGSALPGDNLVVDFITADGSAVGTYLIDTMTSIVAPYYLAEGVQRLPA